MKKDDVIIIACNVCGAMSHAVKTKIPKGYYVKDEFVLCRVCFGDLKLICVIKLANLMNVIVSSVVAFVVNLIFVFIR